MIAFRDLKLEHQFGDGWFIETYITRHQYLVVP